MTSTSTTPAGESRLLRGPLRPFRVGQYRLLCGALVFAMLAGGMWLIALVWQIIALGGGAAELSYVSTAAAVGMIGASLFGGVFADRVPQRRIMLTVAVLRAAGVAVVASLAAADVLHPWHLAVVALVIGTANGFTYPAYSALLPSVIAADDLMAANGLEGMLRPTVMQAAGPAVASLVIGASSPAAALALVAVLELGGVGCLLGMRSIPLHRDGVSAGVRAVLGDLRDGVGYVARTPWLLTTLLFASAMLLVIMGPIEVLLPFVVKNRAGGGPGSHAIVMAAFGLGGAVGSLGMASLRMPRRYLTVMLLTWGAGCVPLVALGLTRSVWVMAGTVFVCGALFNGPLVIWGTLLQRRVPKALLGRVSSLDFFVSLVFMPVSMALAGPVSATIGLGATFVVVGTVPVVLAVGALLVARLPRDEVAHPLTAEVRELPERAGAPVPCQAAA